MEEEADQLGEQVVFHGKQSGRRPIGNADLCVDVLQMRTNRALAHEERLRSLLPVETFSYGTQNVHFPIGKPSRPLMLADSLP